MPMSEELWRTSESPDELLPLLASVNGRKLRLIACGCVRQVWRLLDPSFQGAIEVLERSADDPTLTDPRTASPTIDERYLHSKDRIDAAWAVSLAGGNLASELPKCLQRAR